MLRFRNEFESGARNEFGLLSIAWKFRDFKASDSRDKLHALLGLLPPEDRLISPQYSTSTREVFQNFARRWINRYGSLLVINLVGLQTRNGGYELG